MASAPERFDVEKVRNEVSKINNELFCGVKKLNITKIHQVINVFPQPLHCLIPTFFCINFQVVAC